MGACPRVLTFANRSLLHQSPEHIGTIVAVCRPVEGFFDEAVTKISGNFHSRHIVPRPPITASFTPDFLLSLDIATLSTRIAPQRRHIRAPALFSFFLVLYRYRWDKKNCTARSLGRPLRYFEYIEFQHNESECNSATATFTNLKFRLRGRILNVLAFFTAFRRIRRALRRRPFAKKHQKHHHFFKRVPDGVTRSLHKPTTNFISYFAPAGNFFLRGCFFFSVILF